jgi:hypothetical protein
MPALNDEQATALLKKKWDDEKAFTEAGLAQYCRNNIGTSYSRSSVYDPRGTNVAKQPWWVYREEARMQLNVYETSEVLRAISGHFLYQYFPHVSKDDPTMIAYTPAHESAVVDKQVKTTLGRFLRKHALFLSDADIQALDAQHRAELTIEIKYASTKDEIEFVYTNMEGDSGCMRYSGGHWQLPDGVHPSHVYEAPGMAVAYTQSEDGKIKSRSVVWTNPDKPEDKRYLRLYGDHRVLKSKLENAGFRLANLAGARIARINRKSSPDGSYLMPFIDGVGGNQDNYDGRYVMLDSDPRYIRILTRDHASKINRLRSDAAQVANNHSGVRVSLVAPPDTSGVCGLTGKKYDALLDPVTIVKVMLVDGSIVSALVEALHEDTNYNFSAAFAIVKGKKEHVYVSHNAVLNKVGKPSTFVYDHETVVDTDEAREFYGFKRLSEQYYTDDKSWYKSDDIVQLVDGKYIKSSDALTIMADECSSLVHVSELDAWRAKGFVNASPLTTKRRALINPKGAQTGRTRGGTYFHKRMQDDKFCELMDGTWVEQNKAETLYVFGTYIKYLRGETGPDLENGDQLAAILPKTALYKSVMAERVRALECRTSADVQRSLNAMGEHLRGAVHRYGAPIDRFARMGADGMPVREAAKSAGRWFDVRANVASWRGLPDGEQLATRTVPQKAFTVFDVVNTHLGSVYDEVVDHGRQLVAAEREAVRLAAEAKEEAARVRREAEAAALAAARTKQQSLQAEIDKLLDGLDAA